MTISGQHDPVNRSLRICVLTQQLGSVFSGIGQHTRNLVTHLTTAGHRVWVVAPYDQRPAGELPYSFVGVPNPLLKNNHARWISLSINFARCLTSLEKKYKFDIIHFTDAREALFSRTKTPIVGNMNDTYSAQLQSLAYYRHHYNDWLFRWVYYHFVHACEARGLPRLKAILAISYFTAEVMTSRYRLKPEHIYICHYSVDPTFFAPAIELRRQMPSHPPYVLFVGGNMQRKGLPILIQAAARVLEDFPDTQFWIVGKDQAEPKMRNLCNKWQVASSFHFLGWQLQVDLLKLYAQADVFTIPSLIEAFGVVFLEAMSAGVPVIGTNVGGIPEIIQDGQNGLLVPPSNPMALAETIVELLRDKTLKEKFQCAGLATAQSFNVEHMMEITYGVYQKLVENRIFQG